MNTIGLFYASSTGATKGIAANIQSKLANVELINVDGCDKDAMKEFSKIIIGVSTWGEGDLQDDWEEYLPHLEKIDFSQKTVAFFGLGDQEDYADNYLDAMGTLYNSVVQRGAKVVGSWPIEGYDFDESTALIDDEFVGLALDEDNQFDQTKERVEQWVEQINPYFTSSK